VTIEFSVNIFSLALTYMMLKYEGAAAEGGRSPSIWDTFTHSERNTDGGTGDIASDGCHKYKVWFLS